MPISWEISELANGLRVVTTPLTTAQSVSVSLFIGTGSRAEERGSQGLAHFLEHMVFGFTSLRATPPLVTTDHLNPNKPVGVNSNSFSR